jgi:hypothetical protein
MDLRQVLATKRIRLNDIQVELHLSGATPKLEYGEAEAPLSYCGPTGRYYYVLLEF